MIPLRAAFFVSWDPNSLASLRKHYKDIDLLMPEQLHAVSADGAITVVDYDTQSHRKARPCRGSHAPQTGQAPPVDALSESAHRTSHDGFAQQLRRRGLARKGTCPTPRQPRLASPSHRRTRRNMPCKPTRRASSSILRKYLYDSQPDYPPVHCRTGRGPSLCGTQGHDRSSRLVTMNTTTNSSGRKPMPSSS
jgi:hypothetical protein